MPFLIEPDSGGNRWECSIYAHDCPRGEKCVAWAHDGGNVWNASKCVPIPDEPAAVGEPCHVMGSATSGLDDCELGAMCWDVDPQTLEGTCVAFCMGDPSNPYCEDPSTLCTICSESCLPLCITPCNAVEQSCLEGQACYPILNIWDCAPDASGRQGGYGDPCQFVNECDPGLVCLSAAAVPPGQPCAGAAGCCTEICDLFDPIGDLQCAGAAGGQECLPWYPAGAAPLGLENVGTCAVPP